jgi:hypothetical protein
MSTEPESIPEEPAVMKRSRAKIWVRAGIFAIFTVLFSVALYEDIVRGVFPLWGVIVIALPAIAFGLWMSRFVPMQVHLHHQHITFSFDRIYFVLILTLVIVKVAASKFPGWEVLADVIMVFILGMMFGRIGGIGLRVRGLKEKHDFDGGG